MPYFRVFVEGKNITVPMGDATAVGFFTTRVVRARSADEAADKVRAMIVADWTTGRYAAWNNGNAPILVIEDVWPSPWYRNIFFRNDGHTFYPEDADVNEV